MSKNAYHILGLDPDANDDAVGGAYRRLAKALHPTVNKRPTADQEFMDLTWARDALLDPALRRDHDHALMRVKPDAETDSIIKPKKKKKKKKRQQAEPEPYQYSPPPFTPAPEMHYDHGGYGRGDFDVIPPGYGSDDNLGGIL